MLPVIMNLEASPNLIFSIIRVAVAMVSLHSNGTLIKTTDFCLLKFHRGAIVFTTGELVFRM